MKMKFSHFTFFLVLTLASCLPLSRETGVVELNDLSKNVDTNVKIELDSDQFVYKVSLKIEGEADGIFEINNIIFQSGKVDTVINNMDWYQEDYPISFKPISFSEGNSKVKLSFFIQE
jgi:hypothetical protein